MAVVTLACGLPSRYDVSTVVEGLQYPTDAAFAPDGSLLITERFGDINVWRNGALTTLGRPADMAAFQEGGALAPFAVDGMSSIAVDPDFARNRWIYTCQPSAHGVSPVDRRVVRWTVSGDWARVEERTDILTGIPLTPGPNLGCQVRFGPDGKLWIATGDAHWPNAQDPQSLAGKVLRLNTDGSPASGNLGAPFRSEVYAYGFRQPTGLAFRTSDGAPFLVEQGPACDDEITRIVAGGNGGWDPQVDTGQGPPIPTEGVPMTDVGQFADALTPVWTSGCPAIGPGAATFVDDADWGLRNGQMALPASAGQKLLLINMGDGVVDPGGALITDRGPLRAAVDGPDGKLYVLTDGPAGTVFTVDPVP